MRHLILVLVITAIGGGICLYGTFAPNFLLRQNYPVAGCQATLRNLGIATAFYLNDHEGEFPPFAWEEHLQKGTHHRAVFVFHCPADPSPVEQSSYEFNPVLYGKNIQDLKAVKEIWVLKERKNYHREAYWSRGRPNPGPEVLYMEPATGRIYTKSDKVTKRWLQIWGEP